MSPFFSHNLLNPLSSTVHGEVTFVFIKYNNLILLSVTKTNANAALIFSFLHKLVAIFCEYFKELEEESIRDNFVLIYELLDEVMDFGYPQTTGNYEEASGRNDSDWVLY